MEHHPIIIRENKDCLFITKEVEDELRARPCDIVWSRKGLWGILPSALIQNELQVRADRRRLEAMRNNRITKPWDLPLAFNWRETQDVYTKDWLLDDESEYSGGNDTD